MRKSYAFEGPSQGEPCLRSWGCALSATLFYMKERRQQPYKTLLRWLFCMQNDKDTSGRPKAKKQSTFQKMIIRLSACVVPRHLQQAFAEASCKRVELASLRLEQHQSARNGRRYKWSGFQFVQSN